MKLLLRMGAYWWFPFAYFPSMLVLGWIASRSDDPAVVQYIAYGAFILTMWNQYLTAMMWVLTEELFEGTFALTVVTRTPVMIMVLGKSLATATFGLVYGVLAFITILFIAGQPLDTGSTSLLAPALVVAVLAILTTGFVLSPLFALRRGAGGMLLGLFPIGTVFGGILFPVALLPTSLQYISKVLPSSWAMRSIDAAVRGGESTSSVAADLLVALGLTLLYGSLAFLMFRKVENHLRVKGTIDAA